MSEKTKRKKAPFTRRLIPPDFSFHNRIWKLDDKSELMKAQAWDKTRARGVNVAKGCTNSLTSQQRIEKMRRSKLTTPELGLLIRPPFSNFDRITDSLYITSIGGLTNENIIEKSITFILNCTCELELLAVQEVDTLRVPIDDDPDENILIFVDDVCDIFKQISDRNCRALIHCMAGASRSSTFVIAYLIKYQNMSLRNAFIHVNGTRECCRPNMGFMKQLMLFETHIRAECSVTMLTIRDDSSQAIAIVPEFYRTLFPELYNIEVIKQIRHGATSNKVAAPRNRQVESSKNFFNTSTPYFKVNEELEKFRLMSFSEKTPMSAMETKKTPKESVSKTQRGRQ